MTVTGHHTSTDLGLGDLKTFEVMPGDSVSLSVLVTDGHDKYAVVLKDLEKGGIESSSNKLVFTLDPGWANMSNMNPPYYASSSSRHNWSGNATQHSFQLQVDAATPSDFYALTFEIGGKNDGRWSQEETFYLHVLPEAPEPGDGDIDGNGIVDMFDFAIFALEWFGFGCGPDNDFCAGADIDVDGDVDFADLNEIALRWLMRKPLSVQVANGADDAEESMTDGGVSLTSTDLELTRDTADQWVGVRFTNIPLDPGTDIASAFIQFTVDEVTTGPCSLVIEGQASDNAGPFTSAAGDISSRPVTQAFVDWSIVDWNTSTEAGPGQQTPDLSGIIAEIVNRPGWRRGNSLVFIFSGTGKRTSRSYDGLKAAAPALHVHFQ